MVSLAKQPISQLFSNDALTAMKEAEGLRDCGLWADRSSQEPGQPTTLPLTRPLRPLRPRVAPTHRIPPDSPAPNPPAAEPGTDPRRPTPHQLTKRLQSPHATTYPVTSFPFPPPPRPTSGSTREPSHTCASLAPPFGRTLWLLATRFGPVHPRLRIVFSLLAVGSSLSGVFLEGVINQTRGWAYEKEPVLSD